MGKSASLPFSGSFNHTQGFGSRPEVYAKYGLNGHDGDDWTMPEGTPLFAPVSGQIKRHGNDTDGWGKYLWCWDPSQNLMVNVCHMSSMTKITGASINKGDLIGYSGNTGFSEAPHVHVAVADTDSSGNIQNTNNGYHGWYSILNLESAPAPVTPTTTAPPATVNITFDEIFAKYYIGWERTAAEQDFQSAFGGNLAELKVARGDSPAGPVKPRPEELKKVYYLINALGGLSLNQINTGVSLGRTDILGGFLGIDPNTPLVAGQAFSMTNFPTDYFPDSGEWIGFKKLVGLTPIGNSGDWYLKPAYANKSLFRIHNDNNFILGSSNVIAAFLGIPEDYVIPAYQGFSTSGFPASYIPNSGEWQGFIKVFQQGAPVQTKAPTPEPVVPEPVVTYEPVETPGAEAGAFDGAGGLPPGDQGTTEPPTEPPATTGGEGGTDFTSVIAKLDQIIAAIAAIAGAIATGGAGTPTTTPPAEEATGGIFITSVPDRASIYIDGAFQYDYTPSNFTYKIAPGAHIVAVRKRGYQPNEQNVNIVANQELMIKIDLQPLV